MLESAKQGLWQGGYPPLGYDIGKGAKLVVNEEEVKEVEEIFSRYIELKSTLKVQIPLITMATKQKNG